MTKPVKICTLRKRSDFILTRNGKREYCKGLNLQARRRDDKEHIDAKLIRVGITCSKKIGNAVKRNKAKRRLRELSKLIMPKNGRQGWDYVLLGRVHETCYRSFDLLIQDLKIAVKKVHRRHES